MFERDNDRHGTGRLRTALAIAAVAAVVASMAIVGTVAAQPGQRFFDVPRTHYAYQSIEWAVVNGITEGCGDGRNFCPDDTLNRAHMVTFLKRYHDKFGSDASDSDISRARALTGTGTLTKRLGSLESGFYEIEFEVEHNFRLGAVRLTAIDEDDEEEVLFHEVVNDDDFSDTERLRIGGLGNLEEGRIWFHVEVPSSAEWRITVQEI